MSKVFAVLRLIVGESFKLIGFFAVALVVVIWWNLSDDGDVKSRPVALAAPGVAAPAVGVPIAAVGGVLPLAPVVETQGGGAVVEVCDCSLGAVCTGPRGGKFCVDASGNKRYR